MTWPKKIENEIAGESTSGDLTDEPPGNRTLNPQLKRLLLCQLS